MDQNSEFAPREPDLYRMRQANPFRNIDASLIGEEQQANPLWSNQLDESFYSTQSGYVPREEAGGHVEEEGHIQQDGNEPAYGLTQDRVYCDTCEMPVRPDDETFCACEDSDVDDTDSESILSETEDILDAEFDGTTLPGIGDFRFSFKNADKASKFIAKIRHKLDVDGDDVTEVKHNEHAWAQRLYNAMRTLPDDAAKTDTSMFETIMNKGFSRKYFEACAYNIVARTIRIHEEGSELLPKVQLRGKTLMKIKASERLEELIHALYHHKNVVKDVLDGWKFRIIVDQPGNRLKCAKATQANNKGKDKKMKEKKEKIKQQEEEIQKLKDVIAALGETSGSADTASRAAAPGSTDDLEKNVQSEDSDVEETGSESSVLEAAAKTSAPALREAVTKAKNRKNVNKVLDTDDAGDEAGSLAGEKRRRLSSGGKAVNSRAEQPGGGRNLRPRRK